MFCSTSFDFIHYDICGPAPHVTMGGSRYFVIFIDDYSIFTWIYLMQNRFELPFIYLKFANTITTQFSSKIKILPTDNTIEYKELSLTQFLSQNGTMFKDLSLKLHLKMGVQKENTDIFWILLEHF